MAGDKNHQWFRESLAMTDSKAGISLRGQSAGRGALKIGALFIIGGLIAGALFVTCRGRPESTLIINLGTPIASPYKKAGLRLYKWISKHEVVGLKVDHGQLICVAYDCYARSVRKIPDVNVFLSANTNRISDLQVRAPWIMLDSPEATDTLVYAYNIVSGRSVTNKFSGCFPGPVVWKPSQMERLRVCNGYARLFSGLGEQAGERGIAGTFRFPLGFSREGAFLSVTNDLLFLQKNNEAHYVKKFWIDYWDLDTLTITNRRPFAIGGEEIFNGLIDPTGTKFLWLTFSSKNLPRLFVEKRFPFVFEKNRYSLRFYLSDTEVGQLRFVGEIEEIQDYDYFPYVQWLPHGKGFSVDYDGVLHVIDI